ncbi:MAG: glycosyltransferase family 2 protein [Rhodoferax sp.]|nr:glycosyltransferase family 2 protein [Rhodoferax sp.]
MPDANLNPISVTISVVITTYNRSDALACVLQGLAAQTDKRFEVVIADDGSTQAHQDAIHAAASRLQLPVLHVWHPDVGFTAAQVRNLGVAASSGDYIVLLDGDCVPEMDFVSRHRALAEPGYFVNGSRVLLCEAMSRDVIQGHTQVLGKSSTFWLWQRWQGRASKLSVRWRLPDFAGRRQKAFQWKGIRSCNMGVWRKDYAAVDGFDESFVGWGHEDADFVLRLHNAGVQRKNGFFATEVYHLWHPESVRGRESVNAATVYARMSSGQIQPTIGYSASKGGGGRDVVVHSWR